MPELPEVETVRRGLEHHLRGRRVIAVDGRPTRLRRPLDPTVLAAALTGATVSGARRRGKYLLVDVDRPGSLLVHLGMTGRFAIGRAAVSRLPHTHLTFALDGGDELCFVDPRRFGFLAWLPAGEEATDPSLAGLGVEPLGDDLATVLPGLLAGRTAAVKALLLDQRLVAGLGNIYATEALWRAGIRPTRPAGRIARRRVEALADAIRAVLGEAINAGGTTFRDFARPDGERGYFAIHLAAYGRDGQPCPRCAASLVRTVVAGRGTTWCRSCQR